MSRMADVSCNASASWQSSAGRASPKKGCRAGKIAAAADRAARIGHVLRHIYPTKTADSVAADTGIPADTVAKWLNGRQAPDLTATLRLRDFYGADIWRACYDEPPTWVARDALIGEAELIRLALDMNERRIADLKQRLSGTV